MNNSTMLEPATNVTYEIVPTVDGYLVKANGEYLTDRNGFARQFVTRNSARKRIARERTGNFHR